MCNKEDQVGKPSDAGESNRFLVEREGLRALGNVVKSIIELLTEVIGQN
jgi:hypothetical protein